jgi:hypothetical protein
MLPGWHNDSLTTIGIFGLFSPFQLLYAYSDQIFLYILQENGHSTMYTWILSTGWWQGRAPINSDAVFVIGLLCICLIGGYVYINR